MQRTSIEWTDFTCNVVRARHLETGRVGWHCEKCSPGCANCYSEVLDIRFGTHEPYNARGSNAVELFVDDEELREVAWTKRRGKLFLEDMSDLFLESIPDAWLDRVFAAVALSGLTVQVLTKRSARLPRYFTPDCCDRWAHVIEREHAQHPRRRQVLDGLGKGRLWPLPNVWLGVSIESPEYLWRSADLVEVPAALSFLSCEPLIGDLMTVKPPIGNLRKFLRDEGRPYEVEVYPLLGMKAIPDCDWNTASKVGWVIVGGESGSARVVRPCELDWIRGIVDFCRAMSVPVFVKQLGRLPTVERTEFDPPKPAKRGIVTQEIKALALKSPKGSDPAEWPADLRFQQFPSPKGAA